MDRARCSRIASSPERKPARRRPQCQWQAANGRTRHPVHWSGLADRKHCVEGGQIRASNCYCYYCYWKAAASHSKAAANRLCSNPQIQPLARLTPALGRSVQTQWDPMPIANCRAYWATLPRTAFGSAPRHMPRTCRARMLSPIEAEPAAALRLRLGSKLHETPQIQPSVAFGRRCQTLRVGPAGGTNLEIMRDPSRILFQRCQNISGAHLSLSRRLDAGGSQIRDGCRRFRPQSGFPTARRGSAPTSAGRHLRRPSRKRAARSAD